MLNQTAKQYNPISRYGCYFLSLGRQAEKIAGKELTPEQVLTVYVAAVCSKQMDTNCYIMAPHTVCNLFLYELANARGEAYHGPLVEYVGWWNADMVREEMWKPGEVSFTVKRYRTGYGHHFILDDYNPDPRLTLLGLTGKRFFRVYRR
jgi:hypothetical protein